MSWLLYTLVTALLVGAGAAAAERALRAAGRPARHVWISAALLTLVLPLSARAGWTGLAGGHAPVAVATIAELPSASVVSAELILFSGWALLSAIVLSLIVLQTVRARRIARTWPSAVIGGIRVLVSPDTGPATLGVIHPVIVVPRWLFEMDTRSRRLAVLHEQEHRRTGDVILLNAMAVVIGLVPWHPVLWWQAARLHRAIELDCDDRVVRRVRDRTGYGRMLIEAATRRVPSMPLAASLGPRSPLLEHRIRSLAGGRTGGSRAVALLATALLAVACAWPTPFEPERSAGASYYRYESSSDSLRSVTVGTVRARAADATGDLSPDSTAGAVMELREIRPDDAPRQGSRGGFSGRPDPDGPTTGGRGGVMRRIDPGDPRIPERPRR